MINHPSFHQPQSTIEKYNNSFKKMIRSELKDELSSHRLDLNEKAKSSGKFDDEKYLKKKIPNNFKHP